MKFIHKNLNKLALLFYMFLLPAVSFAGDTNVTPIDPNSSTSSGSGMLNNPIPGVNSVPDLIKIFLKGALKIGIPIVALAIIYCGFLFVFARGNEKKLTEAKEALLYTIIGAAILLGSWAIANMIGATITGLSS